MQGQRRTAAVILFNYSVCVRLSREGSRFEQRRDSALVADFGQSGGSRPAVAATNPGPGLSPLLPFVMDSRAKRINLSTPKPGPSFCATNLLGGTPPKENQ